MRSARTFLPLALAATVLAGRPAAAQQAGFAADRAALARINEQFTRYDLNHDGLVEVDWALDPGIAAEPAGARRGSLLVLVEPRLLNDRRGPEPGKLLSLRPSLETYAADLAREGWQTFVTAMQVYDGPVHQDGRTLLAMREYVRQVKRALPDLAGVVIVGSFPEAKLVRQYNWRQHEPTVLHAGTPAEEKFDGKRVFRLRSVPEPIAGRSELVLSDLDGRWETLYHQGPEELTSLMAVYPDVTPPGKDWAEGLWDTFPLQGPTTHYEKGTVRFEDFFLIDDGRFTAEPAPGEGINLRLRDDQCDDECSPADRQCPNPMAHPDILVSRIDARHIALKPKAGLRGVNGEGLLGADGRPQTVTFASARETPRGLSVWEPDPFLERRLLVEYLSATTATGRAPSPASSSRRPRRTGWGARWGRWSSRGPSGRASRSRGMTWPATRRRCRRWSPG